MLDESKIEQYVLLAKGARGRALQDLVVKATSEPGLFAFSELLLVPQIQEMAKGDSAQHFNLLNLFAYGTWLEYRAAAAGTFPGELSPAQTNKLKQLTVVSLALQQKIIPYSLLQEQLSISSVRALEDYLITECFYTGLLRGKLDQKQGCVQVHDVVGRDVRPEQLPQLEQGLQTWLHAAEQVLSGLEGCVADAVNGAQAAAARKEAAAAEVEEMKKNVKAELDLRSTDMLLDETSGLEFMEDDRTERMGLSGFGGLWDRGERPERHGGPHGPARAARSKKRIQR